LDSRIFKDVPASLIGYIEAGWPARPTWIAEVGLGLQSMAGFFNNLLVSLPKNRYCVLT
jgi:hypothetical protein